MVRHLLHWEVKASRLQALQTPQGEQMKKKSSLDTPIDVKQKAQNTFSVSGDLFRTPTLHKVSPLDYMWISVGHPLGGWLR